MSRERVLVGGRSAVQVAAARPRSTAVLPHLLDRVVLELVDGARAPSTGALSAAGRAVRGTSWDGYRTGRARLATMAASYLRWLAPPATWSLAGTPTAGGRRSLAWLSPSGELLIDLLDVGDTDGHTLVERLFAYGVSAAGQLAGVRLLRLSAPTTSVIYTTPERQQPLTDSPYWFEAHQ